MVQVVLLEINWQSEFFSDYSTETSMKHIYVSAAATNYTILRVKSICCRNTKQILFNVLHVSYLLPKLN